MRTSAGIMFLDVKGYSELNYQQLKDFHVNIYQALSEIINKGEIGEKGLQGQPYVYKKTWGDGIVLAHSDMYKLATVALEIRDYFNNRKYEQDSDGSLAGRQLLCRIAIHFAEFDTIDDLIDGSKSCFGDAIILPARIEPITEPGHVWATNLATHYLYNKQKDYGLSQLSWAYKGKVPLAKRFGEHHIWEILRIAEKDADGNEGSQVEPNVPQNANTKDPSPESEEYHPLTGTEAIKIQTLTGKNPQAENISICSRDRSVDKCPAKARSILAISEMERNGQSAEEESQIAYWISQIHNSTQRIVDFFDGAEKDLRYKHIYDLKENIKGLFESFDEFQHDETWPDTKDWPASFLSWRLKELEPNHAEQKSKMLVDFAGKFQQFVESKYITSGNNKRQDFSPSDMNHSMEECLRHLLGITEDLSTQLGPIGTDKKRFSTVKKITRDVFDAFNHLWFAKHLNELTDNLASINNVNVAGVAGIAKVWAK